MGNSIINRNIKSKKDLRQRQESVQSDYEDLGRDIVSSILNPLEIGSLVYSFVSSRKKKKGEKQVIWKTKTKIVKSADSNKKSKFNLILKSVGKSFIRWQIFNLGYFLGKKIIQKVKHKKS